MLLLVTLLHFEYHFIYPCGRVYPQSKWDGFNTWCHLIISVKICNLLIFLSDGEIISQIKMTNLALAEIKELLKNQVKTSDQ